MPSTVSGIVVSWNCRRWAWRAVESLALAKEVILVDNASTDGTADEVAARFPQTTIIRSDENLGLAGGINRGAREATGDYLLLANADSEATPRAIERLTTFLDEQVAVGAVSGRLLSMTEEPQRELNLRRFPTFASLACDLLLIRALWPTNPVTRWYMAADVGEAEPSEIEHASAACLMVRRSAFEALGGMDERFKPAWFEDVDLCRRLREAGWQVWFVPSAVFRHVGGASVGALDRETSTRIWHRNLLRYVRKHEGVVAAVVLRGLIAVGMALRVLGSALRWDREGLRAHGGVLRDALLAS